MAAKTTDYTKMMKDMMGAVPVDMSAIEETFKTQASLGEKLSKVALTAAEKSAEISTKWTKETLSKVGSVAVVKEEPADYAKAMTDMASAQAEMTALMVRASAMEETTRIAASVDLRRRIRPSKPLMSGRLRSSTTMSGVTLSSAVSASARLAAVATDSTVHTA